MADKQCDLCEVSYRVSAYWTCIDCVKHLCDVCKDVHNKIPICRNHVTVPLTAKLNIYGENVGEDYYQILDGDIQEEKHMRGRNDLRTVLKEADDQHKKLLGHLLHLKEETIPYLVGQLKGVRKNRESYTRHLERIVGEITKKAESLKADVENVRDHLLRALKEQEHEDFAKLSRYEANLNRKLSALREHVNICEKTMKNKGGSEKSIADRISKIKVDMDETIKAIRHPTRISPPNFITTEIEPTTVEGAYGYLESTEESVVQVNDMIVKSDSYSSYSCSRVSKFLTNDKVCCIATNADKAWLGYPSSVDCVTIDGHVLKKILVPKCTSMGVLESQDELVLVTKNGKFAKVLRTGTRNLMYIDTAFFQAIALCVTNKDEVLVCFMRTTASRKELETSTFVVSSKISRFTSKCTGKTTQEIVLDTSKVSKAVIKTSSKRRVPCYVKENLNGDICTIVEIQAKNTNETERTVLVFNEEGKTRFYYQGAEDQDDFDPTCLACDPNAHILVCDKDRVHLLNADGQFLRFLMTFNDYFHIIHCLDCDKNGKLWMSVTKRHSPESAVWVFKPV